MGQQWRAALHTNEGEEIACGVAIDFHKMETAAGTEECRRAIEDHATDCCHSHAHKDGHEDDGGWGGDSQVRQGRWLWGGGGDSKSGKASSWDDDG